MAPIPRVHPQQAPCVAVLAEICNLSNWRVTTLRGTKLTLDFLPVVLSIFFSVLLLPQPAVKRGSAVVNALSGWLHVPCAGGSVGHDLSIGETEDLR